jgi:nicotinate-nucleotide pyrophosphorylase (carboxylating)
MTNPPTGSAPQVSPHPPRPAVVDAVARALAEDLTPLGDVSAALVDPTTSATAEIVTRAGGVVAGCRCVDEVWSQVDESVRIDWAQSDAGEVEAGQVVAVVSGPLASILTGERTALNFLGHLSGIATLTRRFALAAGDVRVWDTRKTTPGLRALEKAAVRAGGGANHRGNLSEWVMLKDNHLVGADLATLVRRALVAWPARTVHVECDTMEQAVEAVEAGAHAVLLDNMSPDEVRRCVLAVREIRPLVPPLVEVSGGIDLENVAAYAQTGADLVSSGALTNSAPVLDVGLDLRDVIT